MQLFHSLAPPAERIFLDARAVGLLTFAVKGNTGDERLSLRVADRAWELREDALPLGEVGRFLPAGRITRSWQRAWVPLSLLPRRIDRSQLASLVLLATGPGRGRVLLRDLALSSRAEASFPPVRGASRRQPPRPLHRALWRWQTARVAGNPDETQALLDVCRRGGVTDVFLQLPYRARRERGEWRIPRDGSPLRPLIARLHRADRGDRGDRGDRRCG